MEVGLLVEGELDATVGAALLRDAGLDPGVTYGKKGWHYIRERVQGFNNSSDYYPILAIVDFMDLPENCPSEVRSSWIQNQSPNLVFRLAEREIESWLLADRKGFAKFLGISQSRMPDAPDSEPDPKSKVMELANRSRFKYRRSAIVPRDGYSASEGPLYTAELSKFVNTQWNITESCARSPSLARAVQSIANLASNTQSR